MYREFLPGKDGGPDVLVLDTEGIDALDATSEHDVRVFALAVLLCSVPVYNSMSHLDEAAVQTLSLMTSVAQAVGDSASVQHPTLYWVLRDFSLQLVDPDGKPMTHAAYLEQALQTTSETKCKTREAIKSVSHRHLVTLPRPHKGDSAQKLDTKDASSLNPKFVKFLDTMREHVRTHSRPMTAAGSVPMTGSVYVDFARTLLDRVNTDGVLPRLEDSWSLLARAQHTDAEATLRTTLLDDVESTCPTAPESDVRAWIATASHTLVHAPGVPSHPRPTSTPSRHASSTRACATPARWDVPRTCRRSHGPPWTTHGATGKRTRRPWCPPHPLTPPRCPTPRCDPSLRSWDSPLSARTPGTGPWTRPGPRASNGPATNRI